MDWQGVDQGGGPKTKVSRSCGMRSKLLPHSLQEFSRIHPHTRIAFPDAGRGCHIEVLVVIGIGCQCEPFVDQGHQRTYFLQKDWIVLFFFRFFIDGCQIAMYKRGGPFG
jgi:hypothetical protein